MLPLIVALLAVLLLLVLGACIALRHVSRMFDRPTIEVPDTERTAQ